MKKRFVLWAIALLIPAAVLFNIPGMVQSGIPSIYYVTPSVKKYENTVSCQGVIQSENIYGIYAPASFVPGEINVSVGDIVSEGDLLLTPDTEASAGLPQNTAGGVISEISDGADSIADFLRQLSSGSLLSSILSGSVGSDFNIEGLASALQEGEGSVETRAVMAETGFTGIYAPAEGVVSEVNAVEGVSVAGGKPLFVIQDVKNYKVMAAVGEADISKIRVGDTATIRGPGFPGASFKGVVTKIHPVAHKTVSGSAGDTVVDVEIKISFPNNKLRHGFSAKVDIACGQSYELITVPYEAIRQDGRNDEYVYTYEDGKLKKTYIITGREMVDEVEVLDGLSFDSIVIFNPDDVSGEGSIVNIRGRADGA